MRNVLLEVLELLFWLQGWVEAVIYLTRRDTRTRHAVNIQCQTHDEAANVQPTSDTIVRSLSTDSMTDVSGGKQSSWAAKASDMSTSASGSLEHDKSSSWNTASQKEKTARKRPVATSYYRHHSFQPLVGNEPSMPTMTNEWDGCPPPRNNRKGAPGAFVLEPVRPTRSAW